jgi:hypothetical protein
MNIDSKQTIAGVPILKIRAFLRQHHQWGWYAATVESSFPGSGQAILNALIDEGYVEPSDRPDLYNTTPKGGALVKASAAKPVSRKTAERCLKEFLARVEEVRRSPEFVWKVKRVILFGSYLTTDRMLDAIDPRYAKTAHRARGQRKVVQTLKKLPEPRVRLVLYQVDGLERSLAEWATVSGIPKTTLFHRVVTSGMTMDEALALGRGTRGKRLPQISPCAGFDSTDCRTGAADRVETMDGLDALDTPAAQTAVSNPPVSLVNLVPRDGIEPPTRGFSIPYSRRTFRGEKPRMLLAA